MEKYNINDHDIIYGNNKYVLRIKDLPETDKPREKLVSQGASALSITELLAIMLNPGTKKEGVMEMSNRLIKEYGPVPDWSKANPKNLASALNIPFNKACQLVAAFELGQRLFAVDHRKRLFIRTPQQAYLYLKDMSDLQKENFRGLYLNSRYQLIYDEVISVGSLTSSVVHPREVFRPALERGASAIIIAHNHPSGNPKPTNDDLQITEILTKAGEILGIELLDHIIIGKKGYANIKK